MLPLTFSLAWSLKTGRGEGLEDPTESCQRVVDFYRDLYSIKCLEEPEVELSFLEVLPQVGDDHSRVVNAPGGRVLLTLLTCSQQGLTCVPSGSV